ncbi:hypothetical protein HDU98_004739 [Podochytrium sp. JEL0797]|nr:hypothetical protein HDU98_004739 [Podochytrium sp. JEL0797]
MPKHYNRVTSTSLEQDMSSNPFILLQDDSTGQIAATVKLFHPQNAYKKTNPPHCGMSLLAVSPSYTRKGLAKYIFKLLCAHALHLNTLEPGAGWDLCQVEVVSLQPHLGQIYSSWGFVETGKLEWEEVGASSVPGVDFNQACHLIVMRKKLI